MDSSQEVTIGRFSWRRVVAGDYLAAKETANVSELSRNVLFFFFHWGRNREGGKALPVSFLGLFLQMLIYFAGIG